MNKKRQIYYRSLFLIAAIYDIVLGIIFTFLFKSAFTLLGIAEELPAFGGYISLIGAFLFVIGIGYFLIYLGDFSRNRDLIIIGTLYKFAYCALAIFYLITGQYPHIIFIVVFGVVDLVFFILMTECAIFVSGRSKS